LLLLLADSLSAAAAAAGEKPGSVNWKQSSDFPYIITNNRFTARARARRRTFPWPISDYFGRFIAKKTKLNRCWCWSCWSW
jgi:hypothetical protein